MAPKPNQTAGLRKDDPAFKPINFRPQSHEEYDRIMTGATAAGMSPGEYSRECAVGGVALSDAALEAARSAGAEATRVSLTRTFEERANAWNTTLRQRDQTITQLSEDQEQERRDRAEQTRVAIATQLASVTERNRQLGDMNRTLADENGSLRETNASLQQDLASKQAEHSAYLAQDQLRDQVVELVRRHLQDREEADLVSLRRAWARVRDEHRPGLIERVIEEIDGFARVLVGDLSKYVQDAEASPPRTPDELDVRSAALDALGRRAADLHTSAEHIRADVGVPVARWASLALAINQIPGLLDTLRRRLEEATTQVRSQLEQDARTQAEQLVKDFESAIAWSDEEAMVWSTTWESLPSGNQIDLQRRCSACVEGVFRAVEDSVGQDRRVSRHVAPRTSIEPVEVILARWSSVFGAVTAAWDRRLQLVKDDLEHLGDLHRP